MHAFALTLHFLISCYVFTKYCIQSNSLDTEVQWKYAIFKKSFISDLIFCMNKRLLFGTNSKNTSTKRNSCLRMNILCISLVYGFDNTRG